MDIHYPIKLQSSCKDLKDNVKSIRVDKFFNNLFKKSQKEIDFFLEIQPKYLYEENINFQKDILIMFLNYLWIILL